MKTLQQTITKIHFDQILTSEKSEEVLEIKPITAIKYCTHQRPRTNDKPDQV